MNKRNVEKYIPRNHHVYQKIDELKTHEFTNSIAFYMAVRNRNVQELLLKYMQLDPHDESTDKVDEINKIENQLHDKYFIGPEVLETVHPHTNKDGEVIDFYFDLSYKGIRWFHRDIGTEYIIADELDSYSQKNLKLSLPFARIEKKTHDLNSYRNSPSINLYCPTNCPFLEIPPKYSKEVKMKLNLALPFEELVAQIKYMHEKFQNNHELVLSPFERIGKKMPKVDRKRYPKKGNAQKFADWFYIYDHYRWLKNVSSKTETEIINQIDLELIKHYNAPPGDYYSYDSYKKTILPTMKWYIEELHYKDLLTGTILS